MPEDIKLEKGSFDWGMGRGYHEPADSGGGRVGLPPGWGEPPDFKPQLEATHSPMVEQERASGEGMPEPQPAGLEPMLDREGSERFAKEVEQILKDELVTAMPTERVNLDNDTAVFRGHSIELSADGAAAIKTILAMEVCRLLDEEKMRVAESAGLFNQMQGEAVRPDGGAGGSDVPEVQGAEGPLDEGTSGDAGQVP